MRHLRRRGNPGASAKGGHPGLRVCVLAPSRLAGGARYAIAEFLPTPSAMDHASLPPSPAEGNGPLHPSCGRVWGIGVAPLLLQ
jgi:hypothetical protein